MEYESHDTCFTASLSPPLVRCVSRSQGENDCGGLLSWVRSWSFTSSSSTHRRSRSSATYKHSESIGCGRDPGAHYTSIHKQIYMLCIFVFLHELKMLQSCRSLKLLLVVIRKRVIPAVIHGQKWNYKEVMVAFIKWVWRSQVFMNSVLLAATCWRCTFIVEQNLFCSSSLKCLYFLKKC